MVGYIRKFFPLVIHHWDWVNLPSLKRPQYGTQTSIPYTPQRGNMVHGYCQGYMEMAVQPEENSQVCEV